MQPINVLVTLDENYLPPLRVMLKSLFWNNPGERFHIYMIHDGIPPSARKGIGEFCAVHGGSFSPIECGGDVFAGAPVFRHFSRAMYFRLLACDLLPDSLDRALYLDPDTLVINPVRPLYQTDFSGCLYAACAHTGITNIKEQVNRLRLNSDEAEGYFNSGVLLLNLAAQRETVRAEDIFRYAEEHKNELILPDQDILNGLYADSILPLDDSLYNYDAHRYETYRMVSAGEKDLDWVMRNTVILHFCGRNKPWIKPNRSRFGILYKHYAALAARA